MLTVAFAAFDSSGAPLAGLAPGWATYLNASTGAPVAGPAFTAIGGGRYSFTPNAKEEAGIIDLGATASPRYLLFGASVVDVVAIYSAAGAPLAGLVPAWSNFSKLDGTVVAAPTVTDLGGGLYRIAPNTADRAVGLLDFGATATPRYVFYDTWERTPSVAVVSPTPGGGIDPGTPIVVDVTDDSGLFRRVLLTMRLAGLDVEEVVHNGDDFGPMYSGGVNDRVAIANGFRYTLLRRGGWPSSPSLTPYAIDTSGNENT